MPVRRFISTLTILAAMAVSPMLAVAADHVQYDRGRRPDWSRRDPDPRPRFDSRAMARIHDLAQDVEDFTEDAYAAALRTSDSERSDYAVVRMRILAGKARGFRGALDSYSRYSSPAFDEFEDLVRAYVRAADSFRARDWNWRVRRDWIGIRDRMEDLIDIYGYRY